ncbi:hypothetical protein DsansV1_C15g0138331 [Dioscorea sansibarensis]
MCDFVCVCVCVCVMSHYLRLMLFDTNNTSCFITNYFDINVIFQVLLIWFIEPIP